MDEQFIKNEIFEKITFSLEKLPKGEYESCTFSQIDFAEANLSGYIFENCQFDSCNLGLAKLTKTAFRKVSFKNSKLIGLGFDQCNGFGLEITFDNCILNHSSFYGLNLKGTKFIESPLIEVDFTLTNLSLVQFQHCDLLNAQFENTNLEKADFRTSFNYKLDPELNKIKQAKFGLEGLPGLLEKYQILIES